MNPGEEVDKTPRTLGVKWSKEETLSLLALYKESQPLFADPKRKKKAIWEGIADGMKALGYSYSAAKCETKFKNLKQSYIKTVDHNNQTGNDRKTCQFYDELSDIFGMCPTVSPPSVASSKDGFVLLKSVKQNAMEAGTLTASAACASSSSDLDSSVDDSESSSKDTKKVIKGKKRKASSSNCKEGLVDVFNEFRKERKEEEQQKQLKLQEMHDDKMKRFDRLLSLFEKLQ